MKQTPLTKKFIRYSNTASINQYFDSPDSTFIGGRCDQPFTAFYVWEKFFIEHGKDIKRFVEFGCDRGHTSVYFSLWCIKLGSKFVGYDKRNIRFYKRSPIQKLVNLAENMRIGNGYKRVKQIRKLVQRPGKTVIFTDCIDKPWEFKTFAPMLKPGDILAIHDWDRAIFDDWAKDTMKAIEPYSLLYEQERLELNTLTRFFKKE
jgi:hypothetical protein